MSAAPVLQLPGWSIVCLRPSPQQAAVRHAVQARGACHVALPGLRLAPMPDDLRARIELQCALRCEAVVFTSPAAVAFAARLLPLSELVAAWVFAVGEGTRRALARQGVEAIAPPPDAMHSEGVLALPQWRGIAAPVGLVTAPGGRGTIAAGLAQRGLEVLRAEVYHRLPPRLDARHLRALALAPAPRAVLLSSGEALDAVIGALPAGLLPVLLHATAVASSPRLAAMARSAGFAAVVEASAPTTARMLDALAIQCRYSGLPVA